jgi:hypothetical protein
MCRGNLMTYKLIDLELLTVNQANDRHGELENETAAIAWLFNENEPHMRALAKDLVKTGQVYEAPLIYPSDGKYLVFDGNRRTTCLKLLTNPRRAPTADLQKFFSDQKSKFSGDIPAKVMCRIETDRNVIDEILYRRHTGSQGGVGQSTWDARMKTNFVNRTGKGGKLNVADEVEAILKAADLLPKGKRIPRANLNRLLSAEEFRRRVGFTISKGRFEFTKNEGAVLVALTRIADDLAQSRKTLDDIWDTTRKHRYLDELESEGILPSVADSPTESPKDKGAGGGPTSPKPPSGGGVPPPPRPPKPDARKHLIPNQPYGIAWTGKTQRQRAIWDELQFKLLLSEHPNAIAVLCRVLLELAVDHYVQKAKLTSVTEASPLAKKLVVCADDLLGKGKIDKRYLQIIQKAQNMDEIVSVDTLNKYVHSSNMAPAPAQLTAIWDTFAQLIVLCLNE